MATHCPYCDSESFIPESATHKEGEQWYNQCRGCEFWSLYDFVEGTGESQSALSEPMKTDGP